MSVQTGEAIGGRAPTRPVLRWHGGKWMLAPWIIEHLPPHHVYVEPYGGAASVLLRKPRSYAEVYNDLDAEVVNLFRILRDPERAPRLVDALHLTPYARAEFELTYQPTDDPLEAARRLVLRSFAGFGSDGHSAHVRTGFRRKSNNSMTTPYRDWSNYPGELVAVVERLRGVCIDNRPAIEVMGYHDRADTLHYVDPPYLPETRSTKRRKSGERYHAYTHEMTKAEHVELLEYLHTVEGMVVLSGYPSKLYEGALGDWHRVQRDARADGMRPRIEVLWMNPAALKRWRAANAQGDLPGVTS